MTTKTRSHADATPSRRYPFLSGGTVPVAWLGVFTGYAAILSIVTQGASSAWGTCAAVAYGAAALTAWWWRGCVVPLLIGLSGAVVVPTIWLAIRWPGAGEASVVARSASLLLHHGSPYLPSGQLLSVQSYNPYLPAMSVFGFPHAAGLPGLLGNPTSWMAATSVVLAAAAIAVGLPHRARSQAAGVETVRNTALAVMSPVLALPIALGVNDPPMIALICLALACASRSARGTAWTALAALALGVACAMKATAWPALPVIAAMIAARDGGRAAVRFAATAAATAVLLIGALAPALIRHPDSFRDNIIYYPLGLTPHLTPAASPLPGHLLASTGAVGHLAAIGLLLLAGAAVALSLLVRPPLDARAAAVRLAVGLTLLFMLAPAARFGYFAYPAALLGWLALTRPATPARPDEPQPVPT